MSLENFQEIFNFPKAHADVITTSHLIEDLDHEGTEQIFLVTCSKDNWIKLWDLDRKILLKSISKAHSCHYVTSSALYLPMTQTFRHRQTLVATVGGMQDLSIKVWSVWKQKLLFMFPRAHKDLIKSIEFIELQDNHTNSPFLISLSYDATLKIWNLKKRCQILNLKLDIIAESFVLFKSVNFSFKKGRWGIGVLDFQNPRLKIYEIRKREPKNDVQGFYSYSNYDREMVIKSWNIANITYFGIAHRYGCVIWNYEGNYKIYEVENLKALFPGRIGSIFPPEQNKLHIFFTNDKMIYVIKFQILEYLLKFKKLKTLQSPCIITDLQFFTCKNHFIQKNYLVKALNILSYNCLNVSYQAIEDDL